MFVKLGDIAEILLSNVDKKSRPIETKVYLCNYVDVYKNYAITKRMTSSFLEATANEQTIRKFSIMKGYLAITKDSETRDDIGVGTYFADDLDNVLLGYHCALIKPNNKIVYSKYLNAFIQSYFVRKYYELTASGSGQRYTLTLDIIKSSPILLPDYKTQMKIGNLLSEIDLRIEKNNAMVKKLQVLAHESFHYFFKNYSSEKEPLCTFIIEQKKSVLQVNEVKETEGFIPFFTSGDTIKHIDYNLVDGFNLFLSTGGNASVKSYYGKASYSTDAWCIKANNNMHFYIYEYLKLIEDKMDILYFHGTGLKHLQKSLFLKSEINVPSRENLSKYNTVVEPIFKMISDIQRAIIKLNNLKNKLLPLLINGQLIGAFTEAVD